MAGLVGFGKAAETTALQSQQYIRSPNDIKLSKVASPFSVVLPASWPLEQKKLFVLTTQILVFYGTHGSIYAEATTCSMRDISIMLLVKAEKSFYVVASSIFIAHRSSPTFCLSLFNPPQ